MSRVHRGAGAEGEGVGFRLVEPTGLVYKQSSEEPAGLSVEMLVLLVGQVVSRIKMTSQVLGVRVQIQLEQYSCFQNLSSEKA